MGILIAFVTYLTSPLVPGFFGLQTDSTHFQQVFLFFGVACALIFPTGIAAEILRGLDRIPTHNTIQALALLLQTLGTLWIMAYSPNLMLLSLFTLGTTLMANLLMFYYAFRALSEGFRLKTPDFKLLKELAGFSLYAWIITLTNLVVFRSDQLVIGSTLGVSLIAGYQIANRLADLFRQICTPLLDYLGPLAAWQFYQNEHEALKQILLDTNRRVTLIASLLILPLLWNLSEFLHLWLKIDATEVIQCAILLLVSMWVQVSLKSTTTQVMLMSQGHRRLMFAALAEAILNLSLSLLLAKPLGILGVALGTLLPNVLLALLFYVPQPTHKIPGLFYVYMSAFPVGDASVCSCVLAYKPLSEFSDWAGHISC